MRQEPFYISNKMSVSLEYCLEDCQTFEEFESRFSDEFLMDDARVGNYLERLMWKYDKDYATISRLAGLDRSYVGNIIRGKKNNPSRDALIAICLAAGTDVEEVVRVGREGLFGVGLKGPIISRVRRANASKCSF